MRRILALPALAIAFLLACAPAVQRTYIAPSYDTIISTTEEHQADPPLHLIYVENHSTVPVVVFSLRFTDCENVNVQCGAHPANVHLDAGQRELVERVGAKVPTQRWNYSFGFSWHADSSYGTKVLGALAEAGDSSARVKLASRAHYDSLRHTDVGLQYNELTPPDFAALGPRMVAMRPYPESLVVKPGDRTSIESIRMLLVDSAGTVLGQTRWVRWTAPNGAVEFAPPRMLIAKRPGRSVLRFSLSDDAQKMIPTRINQVEYPVIVAYTADAHAPVFEGRTLDADTRKPLACAEVALEDSAQNIVAREHTSVEGTFVLSSPHPGTYRIRVATPGWAPVYGPDEVGKADEDKQHEYVVKFTEQVPRFSAFVHNGNDIEHAHPIAISTSPLEPTPARGNAKKKAASTENLVSSVTLGGSEIMPILGVVSRAPAGTSWMQFVVDSTGHVDVSSITLPGDTTSRRLTIATTTLPRVRFAPAREDGKPVCELLRMQVNFSAR